MKKVLKKLEEYLDYFVAGAVALSVAGVLSVENLKALVAGVLSVVLLHFAKTKTFPSKQNYSDILAEEVAEIVAKPVKKAAVRKKAVAKKAVAKNPDIGGGGLPNDVV